MTNYLRVIFSATYVISFFLPTKFCGKECVHAYAYVCMHLPVQICFCLFCLCICLFACFDWCSKLTRQKIFVTLKMKNYLLCVTYCTFVLQASQKLCATLIKIE